MTQQEFKDFESLYSKIILRAKDVIEKLAKETEYYLFTNAADSFNSEDACVEMYKDVISIYGDCVSKTITFCREPHFKPEIPLDVFYSDEALNNFIVSFKEKMKEDNRKYEEAEYKRYLELKAKFEGK